MRSRALGIVLGYAADRVLGDPQRGHPVAGFGRLSQVVERRLYADTRARGVVHAVVLIAAPVGLGIVAERTRYRPLLHGLATAAATWVVLGGRTLEREALAVGAFLEVEDLPGARVQVQRLVGRDTDDLDASEIARAVIESVAENSSDAVVAPLVWGALAGIPGLLGYRAVNTLDAMVGHHNARYENYGWASARIDDLANLPGSRLTGALVLGAAPGRARRAMAAWRRDAAAHPSPNAGVVEATFAGALGIRLGGTNRYYGQRIEHRAVMGDGRAPQAVDIARATTLARRVGWGAAIVSGLVALRGQRGVRTQSPQ